MMHVSSGLAVTSLVMAATVFAPAGAAYASAPESAATAVSRALPSAPILEGAGRINETNEVAGNGVTVTGLDKGNSVTRSAPSGGQVLTVLRRGDTARFKITTPDGAKITEEPGGGLLIASDEMIYGALDAPWAVDAKGKRLPTSYRVEGTTIVQKVNTSSADFPIVADPTFRLCDWYTAVCMKLNYWETRRVSETFVVGVGAATAALCSLIPWSPWYVGAVRVACTGIVAAYYWALRGTFLTAKAQGRCVQLKFNIPPTVALRGWGVVNC